MGRMNVEPLMTFSDGSYLAISTDCSKDGDFSCSVYNVVETGDHLDFRNIVSNLVSTTTCLSAQEQAYRYTLQLYPNAAVAMKKPPYLIWPGPQTSRN